MKKVSLSIVFLFCISGITFAQVDFTDNLDSYNTSLWTKADGWTNGSPFNCFWRATQAVISNSQLTITLDSDTGTPPWKSCEYRSNATYQYGFYECRMKASNHPGTDSDIFTYTGPSNGTIWDEVDIEILGNHTTQMQCNYYANGVGGHEYMVNLGFDVSADFHTYGFEWQSSYIKWYVDGVLVYTANNNGQGFPVTPSQLMVSYWNVDSTASGWAGTFDAKVPKSIYYDWIRYLAVNPYTSATAVPTAVPTTVPTVAPTSAPACSLKGDVNGNGAVDIVDALLIAQYYVGLNPSGFNASCADTNCSGGIDIVDALLVAQKYVGLISSFPC
jgi:endo-1,3-1,4-beta-glycanase ExoK